MEQIKKNQSSVEWLQWALEHTILTHEQTMQTIGLFEQAKAMQKKQCVDFALKCMLNGLEPHQSTREVVERLFDEDFNDNNDQQ